MAIENRGEPWYWLNPYFGQHCKVQRVIDTETNQESDIYTEVGLAEATALNGGVEPAPWQDPFVAPDVSLQGDSPTPGGAVGFADPLTGASYVSQSFTNPDTGLTWSTITLIDTAAI